MHLDVPTLIVVTLFVAVVVGCLLLVTWWQNRSNTALAWWGASKIVTAGAGLLLVSREALPGAAAIGLGNALLFAAYGLFWCGCRAFENRPTRLVVALAGSAFWLAACGVPEFFKSFDGRVIAASLVSATYGFLSARELWRGRAEPLVSRYPVVALLVFHNLMVLCRFPVMALEGISQERIALTSPWIAAHSFETLLFVIMASFLLLALSKERAELEQRKMASLDPLTNTFNRRAFFAMGRTILTEDAKAGQHAALLLFDVDHFKRVNDTFGHAVGDQVLCAFCRLAADVLPEGAVFARLGGEEFGCLLPAPAADRAFETADDVRRRFAGLSIGDRRAPLTATVSVGVATTHDAGHVLDALLAAADVMLYCAKETGRNRVETVSHLAMSAAA